MEGIHSGGGKNSCIALIDAGQHALKIKSTNIHDDAKVWNFVAVAIRTMSIDNTARATCKDTTPPQRSIINPKISLPTAIAKVLKHVTFVENVLILLLFADKSKLNPPQQVKKMWMVVHILLP
jgi:hypothetical protein